MVSEPERTALGRIARGAAHTLGSTYAGRLVNWVATFILMRQLRPEDFGHIALAATILALVIAVRNPGLHNALLHQYRRVDDLAFTHFVLNIGLSTVGVLAAVGLAILYVTSAAAVMSPWRCQFSPASTCFAPRCRPRRPS